MAYGFYNPYYVPQPQQAQPQVQQPQQNPQVYPAVYVSNKNEVEGIRADQNGNPMYFHNRAAKEIYLKQYDSSGLAPILTFKLVDEVQEAVQETEYNNYLLSMNDKLDEIKNLLRKDEAEEKKGKKKDV